MAFVPVDLIHEDARIVQAWLRLMSRLKTSISAVGMSRVLFVDSVAGDDATAVPGSLSRKYNTVQGALNAASNGTTILIGPGTYSENVVMPDLSGVQIFGSGLADTIIQQPPGGGDTFSWTPAAASGAAVVRFGIANLRLRNTAAAGRALVIDGSAVVSPATFLSGGLDLSDVLIQKSGGGDAVQINCAGVVVMGDLIVQGIPSTASANTTIKNVTQWTAQHSAFNGLDLEYDGNSPRPGNGRSSYTIVACTVMPGFDLVVRGHPIVGVDPSTLINGSVVATALTSFFAPGRDYEPIIAFAGSCGNPSVAGSGNFTAVLPAPALGGAAVPLLDMSNGRYYGNVSVSRTAGPRVVVPAYQAIFFTLPPGAITSGDLIDLDLRSAKFEFAVLGVAASGTIDRDHYVIPGGAGAPAVIPIVPPFPAYVLGLYVVAATSTAPVPVAISITAKSPVSFTAAGGPTPADFVVTRL